MSDAPDFETWFNAFAGAWKTRTVKHFKGKILDAFLAGYARGAANEREACANLCQNWLVGADPRHTSKQIERSIRGRGVK